MVSVGLLFTILFLQEAAVSDLIRIFLYGATAESTDARRILAARGVAVLPLLSQARGRKELERRDELDALVFEIKAGSAGENGQFLAGVIRETRVSVNVHDAPASAVLDHFREMIGLDMVEDPGHPRGPALVTLELSDFPFWKTLDAFCARVGLDYDFRFGVLVLATPERLWAVLRAETPLPEDQAKVIRALVTDLGSDSPDTRDLAVAKLRKFGAGAVPFLREIEGCSDPEVAARSSGLLRELTPLTRRWSAIPETASWRSQKIDGADGPIVRKLDLMKLDLTFDNAKVDDVLSFIRDFSGLKVELEGPPLHEITFKVKDLLLGQCLELLILPLGLDLRIESGAIQIVARK